MKPDSIENGSRESSVVNRRASVFDFVSRIVASIATLASAIFMATTSDTLPDDSVPIFKFYVIVNGVVSGYLLQSLLLSIFHMVKTTAQRSRIVLIIFDVAMMGLLVSAASAAAAAASSVPAATNTVVPLSQFQLQICQRFNWFCEQTSGPLIGSMVGALILILLIFNSGLALSRC